MTIIPTDKIWTRKFILLWLASFLSCVAYYFLIPAVPLFLTTQLHTNNLTAGLVAASFAISAVIIRSFTGMAIDNYGRKLIYIITMAVFTVIFNAYLLAITVGIMLFLRMLHGLTWGIINTTSNTVAFDVLPFSKRGQGIGYFAISTTIAMSIGPLFALMIINRLSFDFMFVIAGIISLAGFLCAAFIKYPKVKKQTFTKLSFDSLIEKSALPVSLAVLLIIITYGGLLSFISIYGKQIGIRNPGIFFIVYATGIALSRIFSGKVFDRKGPRPIIIYGSLMLMIGFPILAFVQNYVGFLVAALLLGTGNGVFVPTCQAMVDKLASPERRGIANSTFFTAFDLGAGIGMFFMGLLSDMITISRSFLVCSFICLLAFIIFMTKVLKIYESKM